MTIQIKIRYALVGAVIGSIITAGIFAIIFGVILRSSTIEVYKYTVTDNQSYRSIDPVYKFNIGDYSYFPFEDWAIKIR